MRSLVLTATVLTILTACRGQGPSPLVTTADASAEPAPAGPRFHPWPGGGDLPFSEAVQVGDLLFLSGQVGALPGTLELAPGGMEGEARQALDNIRAALERHGARMSDVVKCTVFLADIAEWGAFNTIYRSYFPPPAPARSALGANGLALGARVEIECIASPPSSG